VSGAASPEGSAARGVSHLDLVDGIRKGDRRALARLMTAAERDSLGVSESIAGLQDRLGRAHIVGITGPPGGGKSTLLLRIAEGCLTRERSVGIVAVDPTSPLSGGSVLGDRIRLQELHSSTRVFIRSMASGGVGGGLAARTLDMVDLLDAFGFDMVFIESVGVGQGETDISRVVDSNVVVVVPGLGDDIQALKAGVLETGDIFVVNKSDRPEAQATQATLRAMLELDQPRAWSPPVLATSALKDEGIDALIGALDEHRAWLASSAEGHRRRTARTAERVRMIATQRFQAALRDELESAAITQMLRDSGDTEAVVTKILSRVYERMKIRSSA
jgi:LAO/AO transport system kinase